MVLMSTQNAECVCMLYARIEEGLHFRCKCVICRSPWINMCCLLSLVGYLWCASKCLCICVDMGIVDLCKVVFR